MPPSTVGMRSVLDRTMADIGLQQAQPLLEDVEQQQAAIGTQPTPASFVSQIPSAEALMTGASTPAAVQPSMTPAAGGGFLAGLPDIQSLLSGFGLGQQAAPVTQPNPAMQSGFTSAMPTAGGVPQEMPSGVPAEGDLQTKARAYAQKYNLDPERFVSQIQTESGFDPTAVNPNSGAAGLGQHMPATARGLGIDPMDPDQSLDGAARYMRQMLDANGGDYRRALAAYNWGPGNVSTWDGSDESLPSETRGYIQTIMGSTPQRQVENAQTMTGIAPQQPVERNGDLYPRQDLLDDPDKWAVCGPLGIMAFAAMRGQPIPYEQAKEAARAAGWTSAQGMAGPQSQVAALNSIGVKAKTGAIDLDTITREVRNGNPVGLSSPGGEGHYFTVQGVDDQGRLDLGNSALSLRASGGSKRFWTLDELRAIGPIGNVTTAIYLDNPASPTPSVAADPRVSLNAPTSAGQLPSPPTGTSAGSQPLPADASPLDAARSGNVQRDALSLKAGPEDQPIEDGDDRRGRFTPDRNIVRLGPALRGQDTLDDENVFTPRGQQRDPRLLDGPVNVDTTSAPTWFPPGTRNRAVPGGFEEYTVPPGVEDDTPEDNAPRDRYPNLIRDRISYRQSIGPEDDYDPRDADNGPREGGRDGWNGSAGTSSAGDTVLNSPPMEPGPGDSQGQYNPTQSPSTIPYASGTGQSTPSTMGVGSRSAAPQATNPTAPGSPPDLDPGGAVHAAEDSMSTPLPASFTEDVQRASVAGAQPGQTLTTPPTPAPVPDIEPSPVDRALTNATAPARSVYGEAIEGANQKQDETEAALNSRMSEFAQTARVPLDVVQRAFRLANAVLLATPEAAADTVDAALSAAGFGRDSLGIDVPVLGRLGIADIVDMGPLTNIGIGRAGNAATTRVGNAIANAIPGRLQTAEPIERAAGAAVRAAGEGIGNAGRAVGEAAEGLGTRVREGWQQGRQVARELNAAPDGAPAYGTFGQSPSWDEISRRISKPDSPQPMDPALEPQVREQFGRPWQEPAVQNEIDQGVRQAEEVRGGRQYTERQQDISGPVQIETDMSGRANVSPGIAQSTGRGVLDQINRDVGSALGTSTFGAAAGAATDPEDPQRGALRGAGIGLVAGPAASRLMRGRGGALASPGVSPGRPDPARPRVLRGQRPIELTQAEEVKRLRLDKFPEEVRGDIEAAAKGVDFAHQQRRGVLPDEVVQQLAQSDAKSVDDIIKKGKIGKSYNAEETLAVRNAVASQANVVRELSEEIAAARTAGHAPELLVARRAAEATKLNGLVQVAEGARAEAGRTLRAYRQQANLIEMNPDEAVERIFKKLGGRDNAKEAVDEYTKMVQDGANPIQLAKFWAKVEAGKITGSELFALYRRFNMLSGPRTIEVNALSGAVNLGYEVLSAAAGQTARLRGGEALAEIAAPIKASGRAFQNMAETMWHGVSTEQAARGDIPRSLSSRTDNPVAKGALTLMETPDRFNAGVDQFFRTMTEDWAATRLAHQQARAGGLSPRSKQWAETVAEKLEAIKDDPSKFPQIKEMADHVTFSEEPGGIGKGLEAFRQKAPLMANLVMPFIRTPYNIASRAIDISPLGFIRTGVEVASGKGRGTTNLPRRLRDNLIGTGAAVWAYDQAQQGNITGAGPDDPEKLAELRATGWRPYSVKIGDEYWSYSNFAPFSLTLSLAAAASETQKYAKPGKGDALSMLSDGAGRTAKVVTDMTVLAGIGAIIKSIQDPERYGGQWLTQFLQTLIPAGSALNTVGQATDTEGERRAERDSFGNQVRGGLAARVPDVLAPVSPIGTRKDVPLAQDPLGDVVPNNQSGARALNPFRPSPSVSAPIMRAFLDAGIDIGAPPKTFTDSGVKIDLTPEQQRAYQRYMGEEIRKGFGRASGASDRRRTEMLTDLHNDARDKALTRVQADIGRSEIRTRVRSGGGR